MGPFTIYSPLVQLIGLLFLGISVATEAKSLSCFLVEEVGGGGTPIPRSIRQTPVLLLMSDPSNLTPDPPATPDEDTLLFYVTDASGKLLSPSFSSCELTYLLPQEVHLAWVRSLTEEKRSPPSLGRSWYSVSARDNTDGYAVNAVLGPQGDKEDQLTVFLAVFSPAPTLYAKLGEPLSLSCGLWRGQQSRFAVEWRHRAQGDGKLLYAYDGRHDRVEEMFPGCNMNFSALHSNGDASLSLDKVDVSHQGTFLCTAYLPYIRAQRDTQLQVIAVPKVSLLPDPLFARPGEEVTLSCDVSHFHPLEISVEFLVRLPGDSNSSLLPGTTLSPYSRNQDGTFSLRASQRITASAEQHGARYSCRVQHISAPSGVTRSRTLQVAGVAGLSIEDGMYLFLVALILYGTLSFLCRKVMLFFSTQEDKKDKSE